MVKFSVLIPTRQRHDTLNYAMETVLAQDFEDFELVVMCCCYTSSGQLCCGETNICGGLIPDCNCS